MKFTNKVEAFTSHFHNNGVQSHQYITALKGMNCRIELGSPIDTAFNLILKKYPTVKVVNLELNTADEKIQNGVIKFNNSLYLILEADEATIVCKHSALKKAKEIAKFYKDELQYKPDAIADNEPKINLLVKETYGLGLRKIKLKLSAIDMAAHYNDDFKEFSDKTIDALNADKAGIVLLHGVPGTGKTTFIRNLTKLVQKKFIFLPPSFGEILTDPGFIPFLMQHKDSIIVMEDAENVIKERDSERNHFQISNVLNLTDGMVGDYLQSKIIFTFNCDLKKVDSAITRKGRCLSQYEFKKLSVDKANALAKAAKLDKTFDEPTILAEIFND